VRICERTGHARSSRRRQRGFSLVEIAIGLVIMGLVMTGMVGALSQQGEQRRLADTRAQLAQARDAVLAFVTTTGRLPCPATAASGGQEAILANVGGIVTCTLEAGFLPAVTLGLPGLDANGRLNNAWADGANPGGTFPRALRYAVSALGGLTPNALSSPGLGAPNAPTRRADVQNEIAVNGQGLFVCASSAGIVAAGANRCGAAANLLSGNAAAVLWTLGANGHDPTQYSADEVQNAALAVPRVLIHRALAPTGAVGGMFDDLATWIPYPLIAERLLAAGFVQ
jgi:prepilin-type N-terminal cleavage/methylation domain-containing protein